MSSNTFAREESARPSDRHWPGHLRADGTVVTTSSVPPMISAPIGQVAHRRGVEAFLAGYRALPADAPVRLAKRTSNLFRPRQTLRAPGLDASGLDGVISIDAAARTADVQGMCTYERLVAATLAQDLMPKVVPQLRTITLGGAVTGLGIESTAFRNGLPHDSVRELDILTGAGEIVTARPDGEHTELFRAFPNSFGSLGYATRLRIDLEPVQPYVLTRNLRFDDLDTLTDAVGRIVAARRWPDDLPDGDDGHDGHDGHSAAAGPGDPDKQVDFLDGVVFSEREAYLVLGRWSSERPLDTALSDYTGQEIYYRSLRHRPTDALTVHDYLWRWDTDWFWCSKAFGAQHPRLRLVWPARLRRSDVYHRIVALENRFHVAATLDRRRGRPARERVVQDVELPLARSADFLRWYLGCVPMTPIWLCPLVAQDSRPLYPLPPGEPHLNIGFWGTVPIEPGRADGDVNRLVEQAVAERDGHKSLYSDAYYDEAEFWARYGGTAYQHAKERYDPDRRLPDLYAKVVRRA